jgi:hypothetical protein
VDPWGYEIKARRYFCTNDDGVEEFAVTPISEKLMGPEPKPSQGVRKPRIFHVDLTPKWALRNFEIFTGILLEF